MQVGPRLGLKGDLAVVTGPAKLAGLDRIHGDRVRTGSHHINRVMADIAGELHAVHGMGKHSRRDVSRAWRPAYEGDVAGFGLGEVQRRSKRRGCQPSQAPVRAHHEAIPKWQRGQPVRTSNATLPWQRPQYSPAKILSIVMGSPLRSVLKI